MNGSGSGFRVAFGNRRRGIALAVGGAGLGAVLVALAVWPPGPPSGPSPAPSASHDRAIAVPSASPAAAAPTAGTPDPNEPWGELAVPAIKPVAMLTATKNARAGVATDTAFTLGSLGIDDPQELARAIEVTPALDLAIAAGPVDGTATLRPTAALVPGKLYRFTLRARDGTISGSWAFQAQSPLRVVTTLPFNGATDVPLATGIELTFDQDGAVDAASRFSIEPTVKGRFEQHGRTFVFVPERLEPATLYTVTLARGVRVEGSSEALEEDVVVRFETMPPVGATQPSVSYELDPTMEWRPDDRPIISIEISAAAATSEEQQALRARPFAVTVYRLPSERAGTNAVRTLTEAPDWARWSAPVVPTTGLERVMSFDATPSSETDWGGSWFRLPAPLERGWYLVEASTTPGEGKMVLQVTDVAAYVAVARNRLIVWANDVTTGGPLVGATVAIDGGSAMGETDADGLLLAATPAALRDATTDPGGHGDQPFLTVRASGGRSLVIPINPAGQAWSDSNDVHDRFWRFMAIDRQTFRQTDTINVWGFVRERDTGRVPPTLELRLASGRAYEGADDPPPIMTIKVRPDTTGAFSGSMKFSDLPYGSYSLELWSGSDQIAANWLNVAVIRKPAYELALETDRHVLLAGEQVTLSARATFFDGMPVPGVQLAADLFGEHKITTDRAGVATAAATATTNSSFVYVRPTRGEEGDISASTSLNVFPASVRLDGEGMIEAGRASVTGSLHEVAVERLEQAWREGAWDVDPNGAAVAGALVTAVITELVPVRVKTRPVYDFIAKQVVDQYEYRIDRVALGTQTLTTEPDGTFRLSVPATADHDYEVVLSVADPQGRTTRLQVYASVPRAIPAIDSFVPRLETTCGPEDELGQQSASLDVGDTICLAARDDRGDLPAGGSNRYLFFTAQRGLRDAAVSPTPTFEARFTATDVPNLEVTGVRFTGDALVPLGSFSASFDATERELTVALTADRERYAPGETVTLDVRTSDPAGRPVPASVVLRAVDEKLYAIGAAYDQNPLWGLYDSIRTWMLWTYASHSLPLDTSQGGDTAGGDGGDGRSVFVDSVLFTKVATNAQGRARVSFRLSDDLTSWHVSADATTAVPQAGSGFILVPVGLPFFVEAALAPEYLVTDQPILRLRAYGHGLNDGDPVTFTVTSASLGLQRTTFRGRAFEDLAVPLPKLSIGEHAVTIAASSGSGAAALSDRLTRRFTVVESRLAETRATYTALTAGAVPEGGPGFTTYVFSDAGRGRYLPVLQTLVGSGGPRVDQALAAAIARDLLIEAFAVDPGTLPPATFDPGTYQSSGIALLPYSSTDLGLSVRVALLASDRFNRDDLASALYATINDTASTREQRVLAHAGLAGLGEPVLTELQAFAADPGLTIRERLYAALGLAALGDGATALAIEHDLLSAHGERRGPWVRLRVGESLDDTVEATSLLALLAADLGDPLANDAQGYVVANPAVDDLHSLQQVAFITRILEGTPAAAARFAYTIDGKRSVVDLAGGESFSLRLVESQRRTLSLEPLSGQVGMATSWQVAIRRDAVARDATLQLERTYTPFPTIPGDAMVEIRLTATFGPQVVAGCHEVSDLVPSGLVPMDFPPDAYSSAPGPAYESPYAIEGQRVSFCVGPSTTSRSVSMRYFARIVTSGTYTWEPAVIQSTTAAERINLTTSRDLTIR